MNSPAINVTPFQASLEKIAPTMAEAMAAKDANTIEPSTELKTMKHELNLFDAKLLIIGGMIGLGIFIVAADITRNVGFAGWLITT